MGHVSVGHAEWRWIAAVFLLAAGSSLTAITVGSMMGVPTQEIYSGYFISIWLVAPPTVILALVFVLARSMVMRVKRPLTDCRPFLVAKFGCPDRAVGTIGPIVLIPVLMAAFGTLKQVMPLARPFTWDDTFAEWGRMLFLGFHPWQLTHAVFGSPIATLLLDRIYAAWVPLLFFAVLGVSLFAPPYLRARFVLSFALAWLLIGVVGAFVFASAGPCYSALIGASSAPDYAELMARLHAIDQAGYVLGSLEWQDHLWAAHSERKYGFALGISAMPSMHNAVCCLYVLATGRAKFLLRVGARIFAAAIFIGSVHLGWHYFVDGLFAWVAATAVWWLAGLYLRRVGYPSVGDVSKQPGIASTGVGTSSPPDLVTA